MARGCFAALDNPPDGAEHEQRLLKEQLESELISLRGRDTAICQVVQTDEKAARMRAQRGADNCAGQTTDDRTEKKRADVRPG